MLPSRADVLAHTTQHLHRFVSRPQRRVPNHTYANPGTKSIAHYLKPSGYRVALSGKTHIEPETVFPFEYSAVKRNPDMKVVDKLFADSAKNETPFCLLACSNEPHSPWNKGDASRYPADKVKLPPYLADTPVVRNNFSRYLAEITYFDDQVGQILGMLDKHKLADNTLVMVVSEQGNSFPFAKWTCYSSGLQSAMIVRWPGQVAPGTTSDAMVEYVDITPTFIDAAGLPALSQLDGKSFLPVLRGETDQHKTHTYGLMTTRGIIAGSDMFAIRTVRDDRYRLIWNLNHDDTFTNACTEADYFRSMEKAAAAGDSTAEDLVNKYQHRPEFELFDCEKDPLEMTNLADDPSYADHVKRLKSKLDEWMESQGDQGLKTERDAILHQVRYKDMTPDQAMKTYERTVKNRKNNPIK